MADSRGTDTSAPDRSRVRKLFRSLFWRFTVFGNLTVGGIILVLIAVVARHSAQVNESSAVRHMQYLLASRLQNFAGDLRSLKMLSESYASVITVTRGLDPAFFSTVTRHLFVEHGRNASFGVALEDNRFPNETADRFLMRRDPANPDKPELRIWNSGENMPPGVRLDWYDRVKARFAASPHGLDPAVAKTVGRGEYTIDPGVSPTADDDIAAYTKPILIPDAQGRLFFSGAVTAYTRMEYSLPDFGELRTNMSGYALIAEKGRILSVTSFQSDADPGALSPFFGEDRADWNAVFRPHFRGEAPGAAGDDLRLTYAQAPGTGETILILSGAIAPTPWRLFFVIPKDVLTRAFREWAWFVLAFTVLGLVATTLLLGYVAGKVTVNLRIIREGVRQLARGRLDVMLPAPRARDEVSDLVKAFNDMVRSLKAQMEELRRVTQEKERDEAELVLARQMQMSLLPSGLDSENLVADGLTLPARDVGGDIFDYFTLADGRVGFAVGDVTGKGLPAGLFMIVASTLLRSLAPARDPGEVLTRVNRNLAMRNKEMMLITFLYGVFDPVQSVLTLVNAGHPPPVILGEDGARFRPFAPNFPLGFLEDYRFSQERLPLFPGEVVVLYTDGVTEAQNHAEELFGSERLLHVLRDLSTPSPTRACGALRDAALDWQSGLRQFDDITVLALSSRIRYRQRTFPADCNALAEVEGFVDEAVLEAGCSDKETHDILLAVLEAATNTITHALGGDPAKSFELYWWRSGGYLSFRLVDDGPAFEPPPAQPAPDQRRLDDWARGGMGWRLIASRMDIVALDRDRGNNVLTLCKRLSVRENPDGPGARPGGNHAERS